MPYGGQVLYRISKRGDTIRTVREINTPTVPVVIEGAGAFRSTASDLLKYVSANLGFLHTKLDSAIQLQHLIRHPGTYPPANPMNYSEYVALGWRVLTNFGTETLAHNGEITGWEALVGFTPYKTRWCCIVV